MTNKKPVDRSTIIQSVTSPLGFFVLFLLVVEALLGILVINASEPERMITIVGMIVLLLITLVIVAFLAYSKPAGLWNWTGQAVEKIDPEAKPQQNDAQRHRQGKFTLVVFQSHGGGHGPGKALDVAAQHHADADFGNYPAEGRDHGETGDIPVCNGAKQLIFPEVL